MIEIIKKFLQSGKRITNRIVNNYLVSTLGTITEVATDENVAALTFDDGPDFEYTPRFLDVLLKYNAKATFFMLGKEAEKNPGIVERAVHEGHFIGNHTWDHPALPLLTRRERIRQIKNCKKILPLQKNLIFRPPYGYINFASRLDVTLFRYKIIGWNKKVYDWLDHDADQLLTDFNNSLFPGCILLLHDTLYHQIEVQYRNREPLLEALDMFLELHYKNYRFVTVPELLTYGKPVKKYHNPQVDIHWLNSLKGNSVYRYRVNGRKVVTNHHSIL